MSKWQPIRVEDAAKYAGYQACWGSELSNPRERHIHTAGDLAIMVDDSGGSNIEGASWMLKGSASVFSRAFGNIILVTVRYQNLK